MTPHELGILAAQLANVPGHLKQAYAQGFAGTLEKSGMSSLHKRLLLSALLGSAGSAAGAYGTLALGGNKATGLAASATLGLAGMLAPLVGAPKALARDTKTQRKALEQKEMSGGKMTATDHANLKYLRSINA